MVQYENTKYSFTHTAHGEISIIKLLFKIVGDGMRFFVTQVGAASVQNTFRCTFHHHNIVSLRFVFQNVNRNLKRQCLRNYQRRLEDLITLGICLLN